jgi:hypothetical protein
MGRYEEALAALQEAVELFRQLAAAQPEVYRDRFNDALGVVRYLSARLGRDDEMVALDLREATGPKPILPERLSAEET